MADRTPEKLYFPPIITVSEEILRRYFADEKSLKELNDKNKADLLFKHFLAFITENNWKYLPSGVKWGYHGIFQSVTHPILELRADKPHQANCFDLSEAFAQMCKRVGIKNAGTFIYTHQAGKKLGVKHPELSSPLICFDKEAH